MASPVLPIYRRSEIEMVRGEGVYLFDREGKRYLDFAAGIAVNALGHCHPALVKALKAQADTLWHCSNMYRHPQLELLARRMTEATFAGLVFFCSSGVEAVECGLKMIRRYHHANGAPERYRVITAEGGFHGRTLAAIAASGHESATAGYGPLMDGFDHVPFHDIAALRAAVTPQTGGILLETIQGEGGIRVHAPEYLQAVRKLADERGLLLFLDEVQCGMGRTGALLAFEQAGIAPDICAVAKGIGSGFPLGACLATQRAASGMTPGSHGSTYGNNPLGLAVAGATLDVMLADGFFDHARRMGLLLRKGLERLAGEFPEHIEEARGNGLMLGLKLRVSSFGLMDRLRARGLLTAAAGGEVLRLLPPLIITEEHVNSALGTLRAALKELKP